MPVYIPLGVACPIPGLGPKSASITFPGGAAIGAALGGLYATEADVARALLGGVQFVLAPTKPFFDILTALLAIVKVLNAVKSLSPVKIAKALKEAAKDFAALLKMIPQVSVPIMLGHVFDVILMFLTGLLVEIDRVALQQQEIDRLARLIVNDNDILAQVVACAQSMQQMRMCAIDESMAPLAHLFDLINLFLDLIGLPGVKNVAELGHDAFTARSRLLDLIQILTALRRKFPIPPLNNTRRC